MNTLSPPPSDAKGQLGQQHTPLLLIAKDALQYGIAALIFVLYGIQVCPFLDSLERPFFVGISLSLFGTMFMVRSIVLAIRDANQQQRPLNCLLYTSPSPRDRG